MRILNPRESMTPVQIEMVLAELYNETVQAELKMRELLDQELDARLAYERAHVSASMDPECPRVGDTLWMVDGKAIKITVAYRDDWIRGIEIDEYEAFEMSKKNVKIQQRYMDSISENTTKIQTIAKGVRQGYNLPGSGGRGA